MLSREDFYMIKQIRKQGASLSTLELRWVALSVLSDGIVNTLSHRPEKRATKWLN